MSPRPICQMYCAKALGTHSVQCPINVITYGALYSDYRSYTIDGVSLIYLFISCLLVRNFQFRWFHTKFHYGNCILPRRQHVTVIWIAQSIFLYCNNSEPICDRFCTMQSTLSFIHCFSEGWKLYSIKQVNSIFTWILLELKCFLL